VNRFKDGKSYCMMCEMTMHDSDSNLDNAMHSSKALGFKSTVSVKLNHTTGKIEGWDSLFAFVEEEQKVDVNKKYDEKKVIGRI